MARCKSGIDPVVFENPSSLRKIRAGDMLIKSFVSDLLVLNISYSSLDYFGEVIRNVITSIASSDSNTTINKKGGKSWDNPMYLLCGAVVIITPLTTLFIDLVDVDVLGELTGLYFKITCCSRCILADRLAGRRPSLNTPTNVTMNVSKKIPKAICLAHVNRRSRAATLRVVGSQYMALEP